ncbi:MAG: FtsW/RodA/SpoVE family cell cycle protein [Clostridia bacterium]|nr:FtsW/RodA/SpoVE family cell cycle protein [Clostridia bacterium]
MKIKEFLENVCDEIRYKPITEDISEELKLHIEEGKQYYIENGFSEVEAEEKAVSNMGNAEEIGKRLNKIHRPKLDWILLILVSILVGFGILMSYITLKRTENLGRFGKHIGVLLIGAFLGIFIYRFDYRKIKKYSLHIYIVTSIIVILCKLNGYSINGVNLFVRGIDIPYACLYLYLISFAGFISNFKSDKFFNLEYRKFKLKINLELLKIIALSIISICFINSVSGTPRTFLLIFTYFIISLYSIIIMSKENLKKNLLKFVAFFAVLAIIFSILLVILDAWIVFKVKTVLLDFSILIEEGRDFWNGFHGMKINNVLKEANMFRGLDDMQVYAGLFDGGTDCALISIVAYCGILYSMIIIIAEICLCVKLIIDCKQIKDNYGKIILISLSTIMLLQALINVLMNFNLIPIFNVSLPFISYGNTGLLINTFSIALILAIYRRKDILYKEKIEDKKLKLYFE